MTTIPYQLLARSLVASALGCAAAGGALLGACASTEASSPNEPDSANAVPERDAEAGGAEAGPCTTDDCEYFPEACAPGVFCPSGPFDPTNPAVGLDWRTRISVVRGRSASDVWVAGAVGAVAHFDGTSWTTFETGTHESLRELWLPGAGEITFRLLGTVYTRGLGAGDGDASVSAGGWSPRKIAPATTLGVDLGPVWAVPGADSLWVASNRLFWRLRLTPDSTFEEARNISASLCGASPCGRPRSLHGVASQTVSLWMVGDLGLAMRVTDADGDTPTVTSLNTQTWDGLSGVWAASDTDVWAVGGTGTIRHYTGDGLRWDIVPDVPTDQRLNAVWGTSASDVWAVGNAGVVLHYDGTRWTRVKVAGLGARRPDLYTVWSPGSGHVWIGGYGVVLALGGTP